MPSVDLRLLLFTIGMGVLAAIIMGCWPAWFVSRGAVTSSGNRVTEHRAQRSRGALVAAEVALALLLVASAGLIGRSLYGLARTDPGFNPQGVLAVDLALPQSMPLARRPVVLQSFLDRVRALPGVAAAGAGVEQPWGGIQDTGSVDGNVSIVTSAITPGYFHAIEAHLLRGRLFSRQDTAHTAQVVIVNQRLVQKLRAAKPSFPGRAVGASITWAGSKPWTIVSVVGNIVLPGQPPHARAYFPQAQVPDFNDLYVAIRVNRGNPMDLLSAVRNQLAEVNPNLALGSPHLLVANRANWEAQPESAAEIAAAFGVLALLLAATGLYGLIAYAVRQRERELGVRMALGARRRDIYKLILSMGLRLTAIGLAAGFAGIYLARGVLASQLYGLSPLDPLTLLAAVVILTAVALLAAFWPARRAARADPMRALRAE